MNVLKICNLCKSSRVFIDPLVMMETSHHTSTCPLLRKIVKDQWWKFWIRDSYEYINLNKNENT